MTSGNRHPCGTPFGNTALALLFLVVASLWGREVSAQHSLGMPLDVQVSREDAVKQMWSDFLEHCSVAISDPNAIIKRAHEVHTAGGAANLLHTEAQNHISMSFGDTRFDTLVSMTSTDKHAIIDCQTLGIWWNATGNMNDIQGMNLFEPDTTLPLFQALISAHDPSITIIGGPEIVAFGKAPHDVSHLSGQHGSAMSLISKQNVYVLSGVFPHPDTVSRLSILGGQATLEVVRLFPVNVGAN